MSRKPRHIVLSIPAYTGFVHCGTMRSVVADTLDLIVNGDIVQITEEVGNADIARCRAMIVARFLAIPNATHLVMVDSDVCWEPRGLHRLVNACKGSVEFVCGAYPKRLGEGLSYHMRMLPGDTQTMDPATGLLEVEAMPAGFMCLSRAMLQRMVTHYADTKMSFAECPDGIAWDLFDSVWVTDEAGLRHKWGEDYSFCKRWRDMGGKVWLDPHIAMGHLGTKMWKGRFSDSFEAVPEAKAA